jgi:hypothetical protein
MLFGFLFIVEDEESSLCQITTHHVLCNLDLTSQSATKQISSAARTNQVDKPLPLASFHHHYS